MNNTINISHLIPLKDNIGELQLFQDNTNYFKEKFGGYDEILKDSAKRNVYVWKVDLGNGLNLWLLTAPTRGTSYEMEFHDSRDSKKLKKAINYIFNIFSLNK